MEIIWIMAVILPVLSEDYSDLNVVEEISKNEFILEEPDFATLVDMSIHIDKTILLKEMLTDRKRLEILKQFGIKFKQYQKIELTPIFKYMFDKPPIYVVTAPRAFGKSTNINMMKTFLSIPTNDLGGVDNQTWENTRGLFKMLDIRRREPAFFDQHIGQHPVILLSFKDHFSDHNTTNLMYRAIWRSFNDHKYLRNSRSIIHDERYVCNQWLHHKRANLDDINLLFRYLNVHFGKKVVLLVDDFDILVADIIFNINTTDFTTVEFVRSWFKKMLIGNKYLELAFITGSSRIITSVIMPEEALMYGFLLRHPYTSFFGFTELEVQRISRRVQYFMPPEDREKIRLWANGYKSFYGFKVYNPIPVFGFLKYRLVGTYWSNPNDLEFFDNVIVLPEVKSRILKMVRNLTTPCIIDYNYGTNVTEILYNIVANNDTSDFCLIFRIWIERGYLAYISGKYALTVPNLEVRQEFFNKLRTHFTRDLKLDGKLMTECSNFIRYFNISLKSSDDTFKRQVETFQHTLQSLMKSLIKHNPGEPFTECYALEHLLFLVLNKLNPFFIKNDIYEVSFTTTNTSLNLYVLINNFVAILDLQYFDSDVQLNSKTCLEYTLKHHPYYETTYFCQHYIEHKLFMGIGLNGEGDVSVSCLYNSLNIKDAYSFSHLNTSKHN